MSDRASDRLIGAVLVGIGGFVGSVSRYGVDVLIGAAAFPLGTLTVNLVGSFVLGALTRTLGRRRFRLFLATGLLSSFTTYSTFAVETVQLSPGLGVANVAVTYTLGILAAMAGVTIGRGRVPWRESIRGGKR